MKENFDALVQHMLNGNIFLEQAIEILEKSMIECALKRSKGNHSAASKLLGIHRNTMQRKALAYGLSNGRPRARRKPPTRFARPLKVQAAGVG
jgi:DNA-binding NtrC family response regulator